MKVRAAREGRRYSQRQVTITTTPDGEVHYTEALDAADRFAPKRRMATALAVLEAAGTPAREILAEMGGAAVMRFVLYGQLGGAICGAGPEHDRDSAAGLAARIVFVCDELIERRSLGESGGRMLQLAYALGRLVSLDEVYATDDELRDSGRKARAESAAVESAWRKRQWIKFRKAIRSERAFASRPSSAWNAEADKRLAARLLERGTKVSARSIANQRSREGWK